MDTAKPERPARLNVRQHRFVHEYIRNGGNALAAARAAGYSRRNTGIGVQLLALPAISLRVRELLAECWKREEMETAEMLARLARIARMDPRRLFRDDGSYLPPHEWDEATAYCVRSFETELRFDRDGAAPTEVRRVRLADPVPALRTLAQIEQLLAPETAQMNIFLDLDARLDAAAKRAREARALQNGQSAGRAAIESAVDT